MPRALPTDGGARLLRIGLAVTLVALVVCAVRVLSPRGGDPVRVPGAGIAADVRAAAAFGQAHGLRTAVAVLDLRTGAFYGGGSYERAFGAASVVKVLIATKLLATGRMHGRTATLATAMIERSDDDAAEALWPRAGGPGLEPWIERHYAVPDLGGPNLRPGYWGNTHITAHGMVRLYGRILRDPEVAPWLLDRLHHYDRIAADGTDQRFGIATAASDAAIKQGWGRHSADDTDDATVNTTGYVDGDRYAVAILTEGAGDTHAYSRAQGEVVSEIARMVLPGGRIDAPPTVG
jgi:hypothetical protein